MKQNMKKQQFTRPKPSANMIELMFGQNIQLISLTHNGLAELCGHCKSTTITPETAALPQIYPYLNFDELAAFAGTTSLLREDKTYRKSARRKNLVKLFEMTFDKPIPLEEPSHYKNGFEWFKLWNLFNGERDFGPRFQILLEFYKHTNPYPKDTLTERLKEVPKELGQRLAAQIVNPLCEWVKPGDYELTKALRGRKDRIELLNFMQPLLNIDSHVYKEYAKECERILKKLPTEYFGDAQ